MIKKIPSLIALFAAIIVTVICIMQNIPFIELCIRLIIVIAVFYTIGFIASIILNKFLFPEETIDDTSSEFMDYEESFDDSIDQPDDSEE